MLEDIDVFEKAVLEIAVSSMGLVVCNCTGAAKSRVLKDSYATDTDVCVNGRFGLRD